MDVLSDLLRRARATEAQVRQIMARPPWSVTHADPPPLTVLATVRGGVHVRLEPSGAAATLAGTDAALLTAGDIALVRGPGPHTVADGPDSPPQYVLRGGRKEFVGAGQEPPDAHGPTAPRTYGRPDPDVTVLLRGMYALRGGAGARLVAVLPPLAVVPAGPTTRAALDLLAAEVARAEPGQDAVLHRLLDLVLVLALRAWCARPEATPPAWYRALDDPAVGTALGRLHEEPARRWTVADLAAGAGVSRATLAARFTALVGEPPLTYLTGWRMTLAADALRDTDATVATIARQVGYDDPFAFSTAFKRTRGVSPSAWRDDREPATGPDGAPGVEPGTGVGSTASRPG